MPPDKPISSHEVAERARLISHRIYADKVDLDTTIIGHARQFLDSGILANGGTTGQQLWQLILRRPWPQVRERMLRDDAEGRLLRSNSPFSHLIGIEDESLRRRIWQTAKAELCSKATSSGPFAV